MRIIHRISKNLDSERQEQLAALGIQCVLGLATFEVDESHEKWSSIKALVKQWNAVDIARTEFTQSELKSAEYLALTPAWHHQYPQPESQFGYRQASFSLDDFCVSCGIGKTQKACMRISSEPKWGSRAILQLHWLYDAYFVKPDVWERTFRPFEIKTAL